MPLQLTVGLLVVFFGCLVLFLTLWRKNRYHKKTMIVLIVADSLILLSLILYLLLTFLFLDAAKNQPPDLSPQPSSSSHTQTLPSDAHVSPAPSLSQQEQEARLLTDYAILEATKVIQATKQADLSPQTFPFEKTLEYDSLASEDKTLYNEMLEKAKQMEYFMYSAEQYGYDFLDRVLVIYGAICRDHPEVEIYFIINELIEGTATKGLESRYFSPGDPEQTPVSDVTQLRHEVNVFESACEQIVARMPDGLSAYDQYRYLATVISYRTSYDYSGSFGWQVGTAYGAIAGGYSICQGYSVAFQYLCQKANLWCQCVEGASKDVSHMWNLVKLASGTYHVDITWADEQEDPTTPEWLRFFMLTQDEILADHTISDGTVATGTGQGIPRSFA